MNLRANAAFKWNDFSKLEALIVPKLFKAAGDATAIVLEESQLLVPVDTGELKASGGTSVEWVGTRVTGYVSYSAAHAAYNEFGTGIRGAASAGAGPYPYSETWPGMAAQPFLRPAVDVKHEAIFDAYRAALA